MTRIDRYIVARFIRSFFLMLGLIMVIAIVFDISEKVDYFVRCDTTLKDIIFDYYLGFLFYYANIFSSLFVFITVIYVNSKINQSKEFIAILNGGMSFNRYLLPFFIGGTILIIYSLCLNHFIVPVVNQHRWAFEEKCITSHKASINTYTHIEYEPNHYMRFSNFNPKTMEFKNFILEEWKDSVLKKETLAYITKYDTAENIWVLKNVYTHLYRDTKDSILFRSSQKMNIPFDIEELTRKTQSVMAMSTPFLMTYIQYLKKKGLDTVAHYELELHKRTSLPFATYVLILIAVSLSSRIGSNLGVNLSFGLLITALYIFVSQIFSISAVNVGFNTLLAAWFPNIIFLIIGGIFYIRIYKI